MNPRVKRPSDVLGKILKDGGLERGFQRGKALTLWAEIVGPGLAGMTEAERLEDGVLFVRVSDSVAAHQLTYLREEFVRRYAERLPGAVRDLRFQVGMTGKKEKPKAKPQALPKLSPEEEKGIRKLAEGVPQDLQVTVMKAGRAVLQRQKESPHPPCVICGAPSPQSPCKSCQKLLTNPSVEKEAQRLTRKPLASRLEGDPLNAARYLAQARLESQLRELLPQVVKQPELMPLLQDTARRYLQLRTGQKNVTAYRQLLPETLQSLLKEV